MKLAIVTSLIAFSMSLTAHADQNLVNVSQLTSGDLPANPGAQILSTAQFLKRALEEADQQPSKIVYLREAIAKAEQISSQYEAEEVARKALSRANEVADLILPVVGRNTPVVKKALENFYTGAIHLAIEYSLHPFHFCGIGREQASSPNYLVSYGRFGFEFAGLLQGFAAEDVSTTAQSVVMIKLLSYLGQDIDADQKTLRISNQDVQFLKDDIIRIEAHDDSNSPRARLIALIQAGVEPGFDNGGERALSRFRGDILDHVMTKAFLFTQPQVNGQVAWP